MDMVSQMRQSESNMLNKRPPTPDFLKSQQTQKDKPDYNNIPNNNMQV